MRGYIKILILVVIFAILLVVVLSLQKRHTTQLQQPRLAQTTPMFQGLQADQIFRLEVNSLQNQSLLFRKEAGVWQVAEGKDVFAELMAQQESEPTPEMQEEEPEPAEVEQSENISDEVVEEEGIPENEETEPEPTETAPPENPRNDPGPAGDPYRTFYKADADKVSQMLNALVDMPQGQLVTSDQTKQSSLGVLSALVGIEVIAYDNEMNKIAEIIIGGSGAAFSSTYVRKPNQDEIYEVPSNLSMIYGTNLMMLRDRNIFQASPETITAVAITDNVGDGTVTLTRSEGAWSGVDANGASFEIDPAKVDTILSTLGNLSANSFVDPSQPPRFTEEPDYDEMDPYKLTTPNVVISFQTADNVTHTLIVGRLQGSTYFCALADNLSDVFRISKTTIDALTVGPSGFAPTELPEGTQRISDDLVQQGGELEEMPVTITPVEPDGE
jgi:hypothetical protein